MLNTKIIKSLLTGIKIQENGSWSYIKLPSGLAICWGSASITSSSASADKSATINLPTDLFMDSTYIVECSPTTYGNLLVEYGVQNSSGANGKSRNSFTIYGTMKTSTSVNPGVDLVVIGRWK